GKHQADLVHGRGELPAGRDVRHSVEEENAQREHEVKKARKDGSANSLPDVSKLLVQNPDLLRFDSRLWYRDRGKRPAKLACILSPVQWQPILADNSQHARLHGP